jgi:transmembrane sensor
MEDRFLELVSLKLSGEADPAELAELETYLREHPGASFRLDMLTSIWSTRHNGQASNKKEAFNRHMQRLSNHLSEPVLQYETAEQPEVNAEYDAKPIRKYRTLLWAGGIAAALLVAVFVFPKLVNPGKTEKPVAHNTVSTKRGSKSKVQLPDGTQVWLNADSRITYNENFLGNQREVELSGEAFFDVVRDESRPFIIHTDAIDVKVLGTAFNVRSYADEKNTETALIRGSVEITLVKSPDKKKIILKPNDKLIVNNAGATLEKEEDAKTNIPVLTLGKIKYEKQDSVAKETLWVKNKLAFDGYPIEVVALMLERWYDIKVTIADEALKKEKFTATFLEGEDLQTVMEALRIAGIKSTLNKRELLLKP